MHVERDQWSPELEAAWRSASAGGGPVTFEMPGIGPEVKDLLDLLESLLDPTILDHLNDRLFRLANRAALPVSPKIDAQGFNNPKGHKHSILAMGGTPTFMRVEEAPWPEGFLECFDGLEKLRRQLSRALADELLAPIWVEELQSVRAIRYRQGDHPPQGYHEDPPVMALVLLPPGDHFLEVVGAEGNRLVQAGREPTAVLLPGTRSARFVRGLDAASHRVRRFNEPYRDVVTLFMGITGPKEG